MIPRVVASEIGRAQTGVGYGNAGVVGLHLERILNLNGMGRPAIACDSHVRVVESGRAGS